MDEKTSDGKTDARSASVASESEGFAPVTPVVAVVLAAGFGTRFDPESPKQLMTLDGRPIICWSIEAFEADDRVTDVVVVVNPRVRPVVERLVDECGYPKVRAIVDGGPRRADSTVSALRLLESAGIPAGAKLLIHDGVRPFVSSRCIDGCIDALDGVDAATVAVPSTDTILVTDVVGGRRIISDVPDRSRMYRAQTPQAFRFGTIRRAYALAAGDPGFAPTDDTQVVVDYLPDHRVVIVDGDADNIKITTRADMPEAERIARRIDVGRSDAAGSAPSVTNPAAALTENPFVGMRPREVRSRVAMDGTSAQGVRR